MSIWDGSFYLDFEKLRLHWATPFSAALRRHTCFPHFFVHISFFISFCLVRMFLQTPNITLKTKSKNTVTMLSFYTAKFKKVKSLNFPKNMAKNHFYKILGHNKVCFTVSFDDLCVHKPYFGLSFGTTNVSKVFHLHPISVFV